MTKAAGTMMVIALCVAVVGGVVRAAAEQSTAQQERTIAGGGTWAVTSPGAAPSGAAPLLATDESGSKRLQVQATRIGTDRLTGLVSVTVGTRALIRDANVSGQINGRRVWGDISDDSGKPLATFEGIVSRTGLQGTFTAATDEQGAWTWDGPLPQ